MANSLAIVDRAEEAKDAPMEAIADSQIERAESASVAEGHAPQSEKDPK
jgi:hypothetical protein